MKEVMPSRQPFASVPQWALENPVMQGRPSNLQVYTTLCLFCNYTKRVGDADIEKLTESTGLKKSAIYAALKALVEARIIFSRSDGSYAIPLEHPSTLVEFASTYVENDSTDVECTIYTEINSEESEVTHDEKEYDPIVVELCDLLQQRIGEHRGHQPKQGTAWRRDMDLLLRRGCGEWAEPEPIDPVRVRRVIDAVFERLNVLNGKFCWADQIRSPGKFREKWDTLVFELNKLLPATTKSAGQNIDADTKAAQVVEAWRIYDERGEDALWPWPGNDENRSLSGCPADYGFERP